MREWDANVSFDKASREQQIKLSRAYYLTKSQVMRRFRYRSFGEGHEENLLGGLLHNMGETKELLEYLRLPWMKLADIFFQSYTDSPLDGKNKRLLASRFVELMVKLSGETSFIEKWAKYHDFQMNEIKELHETSKVKQVYSVKINDELLYDLSLQQLIEIHNTAEMFLEREGSSFLEFEDEDLCSVDMTMFVSRFSDRDVYSVSYGVDTYEGEIRFTSLEQMKFLIKRMQQFLDKMEEESAGDVVDVVSEEIPVLIWEDRTRREKVVRENPLVCKQICQTDDEMLVTRFDIVVNGLYLNDLSIGQVKCVTRKLGNFLDTVDPSWRK